MAEPVETKSRLAIIQPAPHTIAKPVESYEQIAADAEEMQRMVDLGFERGYYKNALALSHQQVSPDPFAFFVVNKEMVGISQPDKRLYFFPHRVIVNARIVIANSSVDVPVFEADPNRMVVALYLGEAAHGCLYCGTKGDLCICEDRVNEEQERIKAGGEDLGLLRSVQVPPRFIPVENIVRMEEACMGYPFRKTKKVERYIRITVEYQIPEGGKLSEWRQEEVEGSVSEVFQHEIQHAQGITIYHGQG